MMVSMGKGVLWVVVGGAALILVGWLVVSLFGTLLKLAFYLLVGLAVVGGGMYLVRKVRGSVRGSRWKQLR
jgi:hypothetical protein